MEQKLRGMLKLELLELGSMSRLKLFSKTMFILKADFIKVLQMIGICKYIYIFEKRVFHVPFKNLVFCTSSRFCFINTADELRYIEHIRIKCTIVYII